MKFPVLKGIRKILAKNHKNWAKIAMDKLVQRGNLKKSGQIPIPCPVFCEEKLLSLFQELRDAENEMEDKEMGSIALLMRKKRIVRLLKEANAVSAESAKTFKEIGILNPDGAPYITKTLIRDEIIAVTEDGRYYLV